MNRYQEYTNALLEGREEDAKRALEGVKINHQLDKYRKDDLERMTCTMSRHCGRGYSFALVVDKCELRNDGADCDLTTRLVSSCCLGPEIPAFYDVEDMRHNLAGCQAITTEEEPDFDDTKDFIGGSCYYVANTPGMAIETEIDVSLRDDDVGAVFWCAGNAPLPKSVADACEKLGLDLVFCISDEYRACKEQIYKEADWSKDTKAEVHDRFVKKCPIFT